MQDAPYREIPLYTRDGRLVAFALVSQCDYGRVVLFRWHRTGNGYVARSTPSGHLLYLHRFIHDLSRGDGLEVDHRNRNPLDNRRENLRVLTRAQNAHNVRQDEREVARGVRRRGRRWTAQVNSRGRSLHLGTFDSHDEAAVAARDGRRVHLPYSEN